VGELVRPLVSVHRLVLFLPDMYRLLDPSVHSVAFSVDDLGLIPIYDVVERDSMIGTAQSHQLTTILMNTLFITSYVIKLIG